MEVILLKKCNEFVSKYHVVDDCKKFQFADPEHDFADIKNGVINKVVFVKESEILSMVGVAGGFDKDNKSSQVSTSQRYAYIYKASLGGNKMDFSYSAIPKKYPGASDDPLHNPSPMIFLVDGVAHNHMNFGNFLWGATGRALGLTAFELLVGADANSVKNSQQNGYPPQLDSEDDQRSIILGVRHANANNYAEKQYRVGVD